MDSTTTTLAIFVIVAATGLICLLTLSQSVDAWHTIFESKKECVTFLKNNGNTTSESQFICKDGYPSLTKNSKDIIFRLFTYFTTLVYLECKVRQHQSKIKISIISLFRDNVFAFLPLQSNLLS